jgi:hypothetical protein
MWWQNALDVAPAHVVLSAGIVAAVRRSARGERAARFALAGCVCLLFAHLVPAIIPRPHDRAFWVPFLLPMGVVFATVLGLGLILIPVLFGRDPAALGASPGGDGRGPD